MSTNPAEQPDRAVHYAAAVTMDGRLVSPATLRHITEVAEAAARTRTDATIAVVDARVGALTQTAATTLERADQTERTARDAIARADAVAVKLPAVEAAADAAEAASADARAAANTLDDTVRDVIARMEAGEFVGEKGADWSKDQQAKVQGYWLVVSPTAPANATYTTKDGTTVPVIWQKPVEQVVPVAPEEPFWGKGDTTITVSKLVGVDYKITAFIKDGVSTPANVVIPEAQAFKLSTAPGAPQLPFSVQIEAVAEPGYRMLGQYQWTTLYLDPAGLNLMTSDGFSGADGTTIINRPTDVYAGGVAKTWTRINGGTTPSPVYAIKSNALAVEPSLGGTSFNEVFLNVGTDKQHVAFDLTWNVADTKALWFVVGLRGVDNRSLGGTFFDFKTGGIVYRAPGQNGPQPGYSAGSGGKIPNGRYILEAFDSTVAITAPGGSRQMFTAPKVDAATAGNYIYLRVDGNTGAAFTIDNLVINSVGA